MQIIGLRCGRLFTSQMIAAGKVSPAVVDAGLADLTAISSPPRSAHKTYASVCPEVAEQIESMGAEFV